ncbi:MAG: NAD(P)H-hydrate dehydratase, partial [Myxococcota bacterium]|nr:NAD(P)H-hydrate dehydratase [Myxococcota bacterium]
SDLDPTRHDALVLGPGLGLQAGAEVRALWERFEGPVVADADALTLLALEESTLPEGRVRAITPHSAEAARLLGRSRSEIEQDRFGALEQLRAWGTPLLKGPHSLVGTVPGTREPTWVNATGGVALATAGTGDVLAGLVGAHLAAGMRPDRALALAAWRHGRAGDDLRLGATASDLLEALRDH